MMVSVCRLDMFAKRAELKIMRLKHWVLRTHLVCVEFTKFLIKKNLGFL